MGKYFYHGIRSGEDAQTMLTILKSRGIKSKRLLGWNSTQGYNGANYVSVCRKGTLIEYQSDMNNSFYTYILNHFCFIIRDDIPAIKPRIIRVCEDYNYVANKTNERVTDMFDEWQVKDEIPLSFIIGIGIPIKKLMTADEVFGFDFYYTSTMSTLLIQLIELATELGLDIIDSSNPNFVEEYENSKEHNKSIEFKLNI